MSAFIPINLVLKCHPLLPQMVATLTQCSDSTPFKAYQEASVSFEAIDTGARFFPASPSSQQQQQCLPFCHLHNSNEAPTSWR